MLLRLLYLLCFVGHLRSLFMFKVIGFYSICGGVENLNSNFTRQGQLINFYVSQIESIHYSPADVCYNQPALLQFAVDTLILGSTFYEDNNETGFQKESDRSIDAVIVHLPTEMFTVLMSVLSITDIMIIKFSQDIELPAYYTERLDFDIVFPTIGIENVINAYWKEVVFVEIKSDNKPSFLSLENLIINLEKTGQICLKILSFNGTKQANRRLQHLLNQDQNKKIVLFLVPEEEDFEIPDPIITLNKSIIISSIDASPFNVSKINKPSAIFARFFSYFRRIVNYGMSSSYEIPACPESYAKEYDRLQVLSIYSFLYYISMQQFFEEGLVIQDKGEYRNLIKKNLMELRNNDFKGFTSQSESDFKVNSLKNKCNQVKCPPGFEKHFGRNLDTVWDREISYFCIPCPGNTYKAVYGDGPCRTCHSFFIPSSDKVRCVDPLLPSYLELNRDISIAIIFVCVSGALLSLIFLGVYWRYWKTPVVKTSDAYLSCLHLMIIASTFIILPILYVGVPTTVKCTSRLFIVVLFYNNNINMILTKSLKLIDAFAMKTKVTDSKILKTFIKQMSILLINTGIGLLTISIMIQETTPMKAELINLKKGQREQFCNTGTQLNILIAFSICLHLACLYRAYQCRKLPGYLNEATSMVYASFICTVSLGVMYPIYYFQKNPIDSQLVHLVVLSGNNLLTLLFVYSYKIYLIIFRPQQNTKRFLRQLQLQEIQKNTGRLAFSVFDGSTLREMTR